MISCKASAYSTEIEVTETKGVAGVVVKSVESNYDSAQLQSASAPNPQNRKAKAELVCSRMISLPWRLQATSFYKA